MNKIKYKFGLIALALIACIPSQAQVDSSENEEVIIENKRIKIVVIEKEVEEAPYGNDSMVRSSDRVQIIRKRKGDTIYISGDEHEEEMFMEFDHENDEPKFIESDFMSFQLGLNNMLNVDNALEMPDAYQDMQISTGNSINFHWHFIRQGVNLYKGKVRFVYGLGIDYNNYRLNKDVLIRKGADSMNNVLITSSSDIGYKKNKLVTQYLTVPLMLSFDLGKGTDDGFKLSLGANFGYLIGSHQKLKWNDNGKQVSKFRDDFNIEKYRLGYEVQFGYNNLVLYAKYFPTSIFKQDLGPDVRTVAAGIVLGSL